MDKLNKGLFAFASYNAGPSRVRQLRKEAAKRGLDPNVWFGNVEQVASERIGRETVTYVSNIYKYYIAYRLVAEDHPMGARWITDQELQANPDLVRTMSVKPPQGSGRVRLMEIPGVDLQPCGGTHVKRTGEIGRLRVGKIENKGRHNRRINIHLDE